VQEVSQLEESPRGLFLTIGRRKNSTTPKNYPWIVPFYPLYSAQGAVFCQVHPWRNDPDGKKSQSSIRMTISGAIFVRGPSGAGTWRQKPATMIVKELSHELSEPTDRRPDRRTEGLPAPTFFVQITPIQIRRRRASARVPVACNGYPLYIIAGKRQPPSERLLGFRRDLKNSVGSDHRAVGAKTSRNPAEADKSRGQKPYNRCSRRPNLPKHLA